MKALHKIYVLWVILCLMGLPVVQLIASPVLQSASTATAVGSTPGNFRVTESGAASYTISIVEPPGTGGMVPILSLNYNSQIRSNGPLGVSWSLGGLSAISRCPATLAQDKFKGSVAYNSNDRYCLDGQRLVVVAGKYGANGAEYRTETESYTRIISYGSAGSGPAWFKVWTKSGQIFEYGNTDNSRVEAQGKATVRVWGANKISDTKGNYFALTYTEDNSKGEAYVSRIDYTGNDAAKLTPYASVQFSYEEKPDIEIGYEAGSIVTTAKRITNIKSFYKNNLFKDYRISYENSPSTQRSRISSLSECAGDGACLPATAMQWLDTSANFASPKLWVSEYDTTHGWSNNNTYPRMMADVDGNGRDDIVAFASNGVYVSLSTGTGFTSPSVWVANYGTVAGGWSDNNTYPRMLTDVNGDGKADIVGFARNAVLVSLSTGTGFTTPSEWVYFYGTDSGWSNNNTYPRMLTDVNGDGKADIVGFASNGVYVSLSNGKGFTTPSIWTANYSAPAGGWSNNNTYPRMMADVNSDGRADIVGFGGGGVTVSLSTGTGFTSPSVWVADYDATHGWSDNNTYPRILTDVNGDGRPDIVGFGPAGVTVSLSTGTGFTTSSVWVASYDNSYPRTVADVNGDGRADIVGFGGGGVTVSLSTGTGFTSPSVWVADYDATHGWSDNNTYPRIMADVDGDGKADVVGFGDGGVKVSTASTSPADFLSSITNGFGATTSITYKPLTDSSVYSKLSNAVNPYLDFQGPLYVVSHTLASDGIGGTYTLNYTYAGAKIHILGGGFIGFLQFQINDPQSGILTATNYSQNYPYHGLIEKIEKYKSTGSVQILNQVKNTWKNTSLGAGAYHRSDLIKTVERSWDVNVEMPSSTTSSQFDSFGNATKVGITSGDGYTKITKNTYRNNSNSWILGRLIRASVTSTPPSGASQTRTSAFAYDSSSGLLTQEVIEPDIANLALVKTYTLDAYGNRISETVGDIANSSSRTTTSTFDAQGRFPVSITNPLGHTETHTYDLVSGLPLSVTGPNGLTTSWLIDSFGRKIRETRPDGTTTKRTYSFCGAGSPVGAVYQITTTTSGAPSTTNFFDQLGREFHRETTASDGRMIAADTQFDAQGRVSRTSRPYYVGGSVLWSSVTYDLLSRPVSETAPDGSVTQKSYNGLTTVVTNPLGYQTTQVRNSQGQLVQVKDAQGSVTHLIYDPFNLLTQTIDPAGNTIATQYDLRGRKIAMNDPDMGEWTYSYNVFDELITQKNAKGQVTTITRDKLGRAIKRTEPGLTSTWKYDTASHGIGKLALMQSSNGHKQQYFYDNFGRPFNTTTTIQGVSYIVTTDFDSYSRVLKTTYPTGFAVKNIYSRGYLYEVRNAANNALYWRANKRDASGHIIKETLGNNLITNRQYDTVDRLTKITTNKSGVNSIQNVSFYYDQVGELYSRSDFILNRDDMFSYDSLGRLTLDDGPGNEDLRFQYDILGNITYKSDIGSYSYGTKPHAVTQIGSKLFSYDADGNQIKGNGRTVTYTAWDMPAKITTSSATLSYLYDANHERFQEVSPSGTTIYLSPRADLGGHFEKITSPAGIEYRHYLYAEGRAIGEVVRTNAGDKVHYFHTDQLGSIDAVTDDSGNVIARYAYKPFGERSIIQGGDSISRHGFTGHEHLSEVGLIHMNGRVYDPMTARFLSADPIIQAPGNLQSYNRYSYALNNPLYYTDPSGYSWLSKLWRNPIVRAVVAITAALTFQYELLPAIEAAMFEVSAATAASSFPIFNTLASGFVSGVTNTGNLQGGAQGLFSAALFYQVGSMGLGEGTTGNIVAHAVAGCISGGVSGGGRGCGSGALAAGFAEAAGPSLKDLNVVEHTFASAAVGGTASVLGGGKFANGAITGAYGYLYNDAMHPSEKDSPSLLNKYATEVFDNSVNGGTYWSNGQYGDALGSWAKAFVEIYPAALIATVAIGEIAIGSAASEEFVVVSRWGREGLQPGDWVMPGKANAWNYFRSFKWQPGFGNQAASFEAGQEFLVSPSAIKWPQGIVKGLYGQRRYWP